MLSAFIVLVIVGVIRRWHWMFWLLLIAFLAGVLRVPASIAEALGWLPATGRWLVRVPSGRDSKAIAWCVEVRCIAAHVRAVSWTRSKSEIEHQLVLGFERQRQHQVIRHPFESVQLRIEPQTRLEVLAPHSSHQADVVAARDAERTTEIVGEHRQHVRLARVQCRQRFDGRLLRRELTRQPGASVLISRMAANRAMASTKSVSSAL